MEHKDPAANLLDQGELPNFIATNLRVLRKQAAWSQTELAERVGLNRGNIASYESGCAEPSICNLLRISNLFDITTHDITRRDLSDPAELVLARSAHRADTDHRAARVDDYRDRWQKLRQLVDSSHQLFEYKRARTQQPCKEAEIMSAHYLQLLEISNQLLQEHSNLLEEFDRPCS